MLRITITKQTAMAAVGFTSSILARRRRRRFLSPPPICRRHARHKPPQRKCRYGKVLVMSGTHYTRRSDLDITLGGEQVMSQVLIGG